MSVPAKTFWPLRGVTVKAPNYAEAEKVKAVFHLLGFKFIVHEEMPPDEIHFTQHGRCIGKIVGIKS